SWDIYQRQYKYWSEQVTSQQHQVDIQKQVMFIWTTKQDSNAPYAIPPHRQRSSFQKQDQMHANLETKQKPPERRMERNRQEQTFGSWFKIIIPFGIKYDEKWLLNLILRQCSVPFIPFHYEKIQAQFFVENVSIAYALKNVNGKIFSEDNGRIPIFVEPCDTPQSVQKALKSEKVGQIKVMQTQHKLNGITASLHIHLLLSLNLSNKKSYLVHGLSTIMENTSTKNLNLSNTEVKAAGEMDSGQQLEPEGMCADRNTVYTTFRDKSNSMSTILELIPRLLSLDGQEIPSGSKCAIEAPKCLPMCKGSLFGSEELKSLILKFLQQYYLIHDYGDLQGLLGAYHEEACFSLTIPFQPKDPVLSSMCAYFLDNRNMKMLKDPNKYLHIQLLKHTKHGIVHALCALPKTYNWVLLSQEKMLCFSVNGVFKEVEGRSPGCVCAFTRTFIATPTSSSSLCIVNDKLFVSEASPSEAQHLHSPSQYLHSPPVPHRPSPRSSRKCK
ncbi:hypothetical protein FD754_018042, partial [Muntiacus muntjak]